jgi:predicted ribosome quality control (RQC) complex YloA/Tae2 family protein
MALAVELRRDALGGSVIATEFYKKERTAFIIFKRDKKKTALGFSYHPAGSGAFLIQASKVDLQTREQPWPVFDLEGASLDGVSQLGFDRILELSFERDGVDSCLVCECLGPNGNLWRLDCDRRLQGTLRKRRFEAGEVYVPPPLPTRLDPRQATAADLCKALSRSEATRVARVLETQLLGFNRTLARDTAARAELSEVPTDRVDREQCGRLARAIAGLVDRFRNPEAGFVHATPGGPEAYPFKLVAHRDQIEKHKTLSLAVQAALSRRRQGNREADHEKSVLDAVGRSVKRLRRRIAKIERDLSEATDFESFRRLGELLQINYHSLSRGMERVSVPDVYSDDGAEIEINLQPALSPQENVEEYFRRYRKGRDGHELLARRLEISRAELAELETMLRELEADFEPAEQKYRAEIEPLLPRGPSRPEALPRLPYREYTLSTGLRILVGRDGSDNDRTTFEFARPYELWFHAQQCPGSHVVIKYPSKSFEPSRREIEETAAVAAYYSKARSDGLVPVIYTQRRYVRKPRKAKPGLVTVERESSIMVEPAPPVESRRNSPPSG